MVEILNKYIKHRSKLVANTYSHTNYEYWNLNWSTVFKLNYKINDRIKDKHILNITYLCFKSMNYEEAKMNFNIREFSNHTFFNWSDFWKENPFLKRQLIESKILPSW